MIRKLFILICFNLLAFVLIAQQGSLVSSLFYKHLSTQNNLASSNVSDIVQDHDGFIWIATHDGLNKYDGYTLTEYRNIVGDSTSLCDNRITDLFVDKNGNIWIGTVNNGISVYNKQLNNFKHYKYYQEDNTTLSFRYVTEINEDAQGEIWVSTLKGLNKYNAVTDEFVRMYREVRICLYDYSFVNLKNYEIPKTIITKLSVIQDSVFYSRVAFKNRVSYLLGDEMAQMYMHKIIQASFSDLNSNVIYEQIRSFDFDNNGNLWLGLERNGISFYNTKTKQFRNYQNKWLNELIGAEVLDVVFKFDLLWVCSDKGLSVFQIENDSLHHVIHAFGENAMVAVFPIKRNQAWVGTEKGLFKFKYNGNKISGEKVTVNLSSDLWVTSLFIDRQNLLWIGTLFNGLFYDQKYQGKLCFKQNQKLQNQENLNDISIISVAANNDYWMHYNNGYNEVWGDNTTIYSNELSSFLNKNLKPKEFVRKTFQDSHKNFWVGTNKGNLWYYNCSKHKILNINKHDVNTLLTDIIDIDEDKNGAIWISLLGNGLVKYNLKSNSFTHYKANTKQWKTNLANDWVYTTYTDNSGYIYVGSVDGLSVAHVDSMNFKTYNALLATENKPSHNSILSIVNDSDKNLWIGTENGLNFYNTKTKKFKYIQPNSDLNSIAILGIVIPNNREVWLSTKKGIVKLIVDKAQNVLEIENIDINFNRFSKDWLNPGVFALDSNQNILFGGQHGLLVFNSNKYAVNKVKPEVLITQVKLYNKPIEFKRWNGSEAEKHLVLKHNENFISINYTAFNYIQSYKNKYSYQLNGFDNNLHFDDGSRESTYKKLPPGEYLFKVNASNNSGYWNNKGDQLKITIKPPPWKTIWAYLLYYVAIALIIYVIIRNIKIRARLKNDIRLKEYQAQKDKDLHALKLKFFTNISHEFRTPLTLMIGPIEKLINRTEELSTDDASFYLKLIHNNSKKLLKYINQLMDFRKLENNAYKIDLKHGNVIEPIQMVFNQFLGEAKQKEISYTFSTYTENLFTDFDADIVEKAIVNIVSNAFKYTPNKGSISVSVSTENISEIEGESLLIKVEDSGIGISKEKQNEIFTRFYQIKNKESIGTGIGLAFTKDLIEIHQGIIKLESEQNMGSKFLIYLPISQNVTDNYTSALNKTDLVISDAKLNEVLAYDENKKTALLVDDTVDILNFLQLELNVDFNIFYGQHGKEGLALAKKHQPDIIISDIMMPEMDGITLSKTLKMNPQTSHIPIILLTAKSSEESELEGLLTGSDAYIKKPFNIDLLKIKIQNILEFRRKISEKFAQDYEFIPEKNSINNLDKVFLENATELVLENLVNPELNAEFLIKHLGVSKTVLYHKLKSLTNQSINEFIRIVRLKKAMEELKKNENLSLSTLAYDVGFSSLSYFTRSFTKHFGKSPSDFIKSARG